MGLRTQKKRRKQGKTDYKLRRSLLESGITRIVIRKTNKYFVAQVVESVEAKDKVVAGVSSKDLIGMGWDKKFGGSLKSVPAGYFTGLLLAKKAGKGEFILDLGMQRTVSGNRIYAVVKGLVDGGLNVRVGKGVFPSKERLAGEHLKPEVKKMISMVKGKLGGKADE